MNQHIAGSGFIGTCWARQFGPSSSVQFINVPGMAALGNPLQYPMLGVDNTFNWVWNWLLPLQLPQLQVRHRYSPLPRTTASSKTWPSAPCGAANFYSGRDALASAGGFGNLGGYRQRLRGLPVRRSQHTAAVQFTETPSIRQTLYGFHLSDTFQYCRRLSFDVGVRYDVFSPLEPRHAGGSMFYDPATNTLEFAGIGNNRTCAVTPGLGLEQRRSARRLRVPADRTARSSAAAMP